MILPERFLEQMKELLGQEYAAWLASYEEAPHQGLRVNTGKLSAGEWAQISPYPFDPVPWTPNGSYVDGAERPSRDPYYHAGLYYLQEPSAMAPAAVLPIQPGDRVLDLCAAPGGKSTELGARLQGQGLLVSNDISASRAKALLKNLELAGLANLCVTSETPEKLADTFGTFFDKILVDAPCSGEGMFRKEPDLIKSWLERGPEEYAPLQREILSQAVRMLKPGGMLLYSTCTFSPMEDEDTVRWLLEREPGLELVPLAGWEGTCPGVDGSPVLRLFPHRLRGEGHFLALFRKKDAGDAGSASGTKALAVSKTGIKARAKAEADMDPRTGSGLTRQELRRLEQETDYLDWERHLAAPIDRSRMMLREDMLYLLPEGFDRSWRLRYLRTGLLLGELKRQRFEPSQAAAMALMAGDFDSVLSLKREDERVIRYLKGETLALLPKEQAKKGWALVCVDGFPLGWGKYAGASLKNKYYPGWRWQ